jgi:hypothetical protein
MAIATFHISPQGDGSFNVVMTTAGGQLRTISGFGSEHEVKAWIVQTQRLLQQVDPRFHAPPRRGAKASTMNTIRTAIFGIITVLLATTAHAQNPVGNSGQGVTGTFSGQSVTPSPRLQSPTPLFVIGDLAVGIWARVPPPYDVTANRNTAANPLP